VHTTQEEDKYHGKIMILRLDGAVCLKPLAVIFHQISRSGFHSSQIDSSQIVGLSRIHFPKIVVFDILPAEQVLSG